MAGIRDIAALDAEIAELSIDERKSLLNRAVNGLHKMYGKDAEYGARLLQRQKQGKPNLGTEFKAKGGIAGFANGDMVNLFGGQGPKYRIDPRYYDSPEYKKRQEERQAGELAGMAMTYSPYFGMAGSTAVGKDDKAYEAYVKRIGGNPKADYMADLPRGLSRTLEEAGYKGFPKAYPAVEPPSGFTYAFDSEGERYAVPNAYFDKEATKFMPDQPFPAAKAPPPTGGTMPEADKPKEQRSKADSKTDEQIFGGNPDDAAISFQDLNDIGKELGLTDSQMDITRTNLIDLIRDTANAPKDTEKLTTETGNTPKSGMETADGSPIYTNKGTTGTEQLVAEDGKLTLDDLIDAGVVADDRGLGQDRPATTPDPEEITEVATTEVTQPVTTAVSKDPRDTGVVFDPTAGSNVAAENQANTQAGTAGTVPEDASDINLGDIGEAALPILGVGAIDYLMNDGEIDFGKVLSTGTALGAALGLDVFDKLNNPQLDKVGYQGTIPTYAATRRQVPIDYSTDRRPGSGGRRYFTDMRYTAPSGIAAAQQAAQADATALQQMNQANPLNQPPVQVQPMNMGGIAGAASRYLNSAADGMADSIPSSIDNRDPAALSGGEFVVAADVVSGLGNGNSNAGAQQLYNMMDRVRKARTGTTKQGKQIKPQSVMPV